MPACRSFKSAFHSILMRKNGMPFSKFQHNVYPSIICATAMENSNTKLKDYSSYETEFIETKPD